MKKTSTYMIVTLLLLLSIGLIAAQSNNPSAFSGTITYGTGINVPDGYILTAGINGIISGSFTVQNGFYDIVVLGNNGDTVEFFLNGEKVNEKGDFQFQQKTTLDLTINALPATGTDFCGDGICSITEECSACSVDCTYNQCNTNGICDANIGEACGNSPQDCGVCAGNGICDELFGETCSNSPQDCGACSPPPTSGGGGGGSGGGGGGSSSSTSTIESTTLTLTNEEENNNEENNNLPVPSVSEINEQLEEEEEKAPSRFSWITGAAVGGGSNSSTWIIILVIIILIAWFIFSRKNRGAGRKDTVTPMTRKNTKKRKVIRRKTKTKMTKRRIIKRRR